MRVIPVIDLLGGQVVRGIAGRRELYRPIQSTIVEDAQPATVARAFVEQFGFDTAYVADLDAITHGRFGTAAWQDIANAGLWMLLDAGIRNSEHWRSVAAALESSGAKGQFIVGSESIESQAELIAVAARASVSWMYFSLDMHHGRPVTNVEEWKSADPFEIVCSLPCQNISRLIVLDLADVGVGGGTGTLDLCRRISASFGPQIQLVAGGGVRGLDDLKALADAGCDAALVASALHDGRLTRADIETARSY